MHFWVIVMVGIACFAAGWLLSAIYGKGVIAKLQDENAKAQAELAKMRSGIASAISGQKYQARNV